MTKDTQKLAHILASRHNREQYVVYVLLTWGHIVQVLAPPLDVDVMRKKSVPFDSTRVFRCRSVIPVDRSGRGLLRRQRWHEGLEDYLSYYS